MRPEDGPLGGPLTAPAPLPVPAQSAGADGLALFESERRRLTGLAYRLLGSMADAEDVVQDAWLRWRRVEAATIAQPRAYLSAVVTRLGLDRLKQLRRRREVYVGPWLPEPVLTEVGVGEDAPLAGDITFALMLALERLSPLERAAFLLHDVFEMDFPTIAATLEREEAACRQLASRARTHLRAERPRYAVPPDAADAVAEAFFTAIREGDAAALGRLLAEDARLHTDGGGRVTAALRVVRGSDRIARFFAGLVRKRMAVPPVWRRKVTLNGLPALLTEDPAGTRQATAVEVADGRVRAIYVVRNPDKLARLWAAASPGT